MFGRRSKSPAGGESSLELNDPRYYFASGLEGVTFEATTQVAQGYCVSCRERASIVGPMILRTPRGPIAIIGRCANCAHPLSRALTPPAVPAAAETIRRSPHPAMSRRPGRR